MSQSIRGAFGAVVLPFDQFRSRSTAAAASESATVIPKPDRAQGKPCMSLLTILQQYKMIQLQRDNPDKDKMLFRDKKDLYWHFEKAGTAFGAFKNGELVSMILMHENNDLPPSVRKDLDPSALTGKHAVIGGAVVAQAFRGMGLCQEMIESCIDDARVNHYDHLHARVRIGNEKSLDVFKKAGFSVLPHTGPSPDDPSHQVHFLHLDMKAHRDAVENPPACKIYHHDFRK